SISASSMAGQPARFVLALGDAGLLAASQAASPSRAASTSTSTVGATVTSGGDASGPDAPTTLAAGRTARPRTRAGARMAATVDAAFWGTSVPPADQGAERPEIRHPE